MRARTITAIAVLGALAIPGSASAVPGDSGYSTPNAITGGSGEPSHPAGDSGYSSVNSITPPSSESSSVSGSSGTSSRYSSLNAIAGPQAGTPAFVSGPSAGSGDEFQWADAALGAGLALALVALGGAALLTVRRRTAVSASAS